MLEVADRVKFIGYHHDEPSKPEANPGDIGTILDITKNAQDDIYATVRFDHGGWGFYYGDELELLDY